MKKISDIVNISGSCRRLGVPLWSCPHFIFLVMGVVIIATILATYTIAERYEEPEVVISIVTILTIFLLVITQVLVSAFERVVSAHTQEIAHAKEVIELNEQFVYLAVHDIAAAGTAIKWGLRSIEPKTAKFSDIEKELFTSVRERNEGLIKLAKQILLITRIESNLLELKFETIEPEAAIAEIMTELARTTKERGVRVVYDPPTRPLRLTTDPEHFATIIRTMLANAINHADLKAGMVHIRLEETKTGVAIMIGNNGPEIDEANRAHIFEKIWRDKESNRIVGTGFGLYTVKELTRALGGDIRFTSVPDNTEFVLDFHSESVPSR